MPEKGRRDPMNLQHMKYAVAVAETGSINKAADRLFVGQSNLSLSLIHI